MRQRLSQAFDRIAPKLGDLIEKQDAMVRQRWRMYTEPWGFAASPEEGGHAVERIAE